MQRVFSGQLALGGLGEKLLQQTLALVAAGLVINLSLRSGSNYGPELLAYVLRRHAAPDSTPVRRESMKGVLFKVELGRSVQTKDRR